MSAVIVDVLRPSFGRRGSGGGPSRVRPATVFSGVLGESADRRRALIVVPAGAGSARR